MKYSFKESVMLVSGAASGIGAATARLLAANGLAVVASDVEQDAVARVVDEIRASGGQAVAHTGDVSRPEAAEGAVRAALEAFGSLAYAVNNAGIGGVSLPAGELPAQDWQRVSDINLGGVAHALRYQIPAILGAGGGAIVNMCSILGLVGNPTAPAYVAAKHDVAGLSKSAALAYAARGIRINSIHPGYVETPILGALDAAQRQAVTGLHPIGRLARAEEIAHAIAFLLSDGASFVNGAALAADGGYTAQ